MGCCGGGDPAAEEALSECQREYAELREKHSALQVEFAARVPYLEDEVVRLKGEPLEWRRRRMQAELRARTAELERLRGQLAKGEAQPFRGNVLLEMYADEVHTRETVLEICTRAVERDLAAVDRHLAELEAGAVERANAEAAGPWWAQLVERQGGFTPWDDHPSPGTRSLYRADRGGAAPARTSPSSRDRRKRQPARRGVAAGGRGAGQEKEGASTPPQRPSEVSMEAPPWTVTPAAGAQGDKWKVVRLSLASGALADSVKGEGGKGGALVESPSGVTSPVAQNMGSKYGIAQKMHLPDGSRETAQSFPPESGAGLTAEEQDDIDGAFSRLQAEIDTGRAKIEKLREKHASIEAEEDPPGASPLSPLSPGKRKQTFYKLLADVEAKVRGLEHFRALYSGLHGALERQRAVIQAWRPWRELEGELERGVALNFRLKEKLKVVREKERAALYEASRLRDEIRVLSRKSEGGTMWGNSEDSEELRKSRDEVARLKREVKALEGSLDSSKKLCTSLGKSNSALEVEFEVLTAEVLRLRGESTTLSATLQAEKSAALDLRTKAETNESAVMLKKAQDWLKEAEAGRAEAEAGREEAEARCKALQEELSSSRVERGRVVGERNALEEELGRVRGALELSEVEVRGKAMVVTSLSEADEARAASDEQLASLTAELGASREECALLEARVEGMVRQVADAEQARENFKSARMEKTLLKTQISSLRTKIQSMKSEASEAGAAAARELAAQAEKQRKDAEGARAQLDAELARLREELAKERSHVASLSSELGQVKGEAAEASKRASGHLEEVNKMHTKLAEQEEEARKHLAASVAQAKLGATLLGLRAQRKQEEANAARESDVLAAGPCQMCQPKLDEIHRLAQELANAETRCGEWASAHEKNLELHAQLAAYQEELRRNMARTRWRVLRGDVMRTAISKRNALASDAIASLFLSRVTQALELHVVHDEVLAYCERLAGERGRERLAHLTEAEESRAKALKEACLAIMACKGDEQKLLALRAEIGDEAFDSADSCVQAMIQMSLAGAKASGVEVKTDSAVPELGPDGLPLLPDILAKCTHDLDFLYVVSGEDVMEDVYKSMGQVVEMDVADGSKAILTPNRVKKLRQLFCALDPDDSGAVSSSELFETLRNDKRIRRLMGVDTEYGAFSSSKVRHLFERLNVDGDDQITFNEFLKLFYKEDAGYFWQDVERAGLADHQMHLIHQRSTGAHNT